jgi:hypothetical protein
MTGSGVLASCPGVALQVTTDPYSPSCVDFQGANGGPTSPGVTAGTITVAYRVTDSSSYGQIYPQLAGAALRDTNAAKEQTIDTLATYFNEHFQMPARRSTDSAAR